MDRIAKAAGKGTSVALDAPRAKLSEAPRGRQSAYVSTTFVLRGGPTEIGALGWFRRPCPTEGKSRHPYLN